MTPTSRQVGRPVRSPPGDWLLRRVGRAGPHVLAGLICLDLLIPAAAAWAGTLALLVGLLIGLPHGAVDHLVPAWISARARPLRITVGLLLAYAGTATATATATVALFLWAPVPTLTGFLILAVLHFGTGDVAYHAERDGQPRVRPVLAVLAYGGPPVVLPIALWPGTVDPLLDAVAPGASAAFAPVGRLIALSVVLVAVVVTGFRELTTGRGGDAAALAILVAAFAWVPPPLAFGGYFAAWHSARHIARLLRADPANEHRLAVRQWGGPVRRFARQAALPTIVAAAGLLALLYATGETPTVSGITAVPFAADPLQVVFAVLAGLTVPHAAVVARLDNRTLPGPVTAS
ncbi:Brp/Blh family beta-carotene 15,15'-dioxygenase [Micromonospora andamanensis]|uniref:Brp/Blh family beta-carotene 15,15'-dioxygenase n=1 Tax=Micromonospora andamanensis TaxID=1287068 RepID=UPI001951FFEB|nr:Brp/Blh family beta-carotene 15,15'-dioxygenase [Micromonospora andamanensis]GIJ36949.1 beta-carotene 15,15'-dioxygenase [Micromonospora andamanensis]